MPRKRCKTEEIIQKLREAEVLLSQGRNVSEACRQIGVTDNTYYRWRKEYGGIRSEYLTTHGSDGSLNLMRRFQLLLISRGECQLNMQQT